MVKTSMHKISAGHRAYLVTQLQSKAFTPEKAADFASKQWGEELDVESVRTYMEGRPDPLGPSVSVEPATLPELAISESISKDLEVVEMGLSLIKHQYALPSGKLVDILCKDTKDAFVVIEVKKFASREAIDQLLGYMAELKKQHPESEVRGVIMSSSYDVDLSEKLGLLANSGITLKYYKLKVLAATEEELKKR